MGDVTAVMMDCITEKSGHSVTPMAVSVCITPAAPAPLPLPYPVMASSIEGIGDAPMRTKINGALIGTVGSVLKTCHGNELVSLNTAGPCFIIMGAPVVLCELGMMGITGSMCMQNKAPTPGAGGSASDAGGSGGAGSGGGEAGGGGGDGHGPGGPAGGGGAGGGGSNTGAAGPGSSSGAAGEHQCQGGHPVDLVTGYVVDEQIDLILPGTLPFTLKRNYSSSRRSDGEATLGPGWAHGFEQRITAEDRVIVLREAEGREVRFARIGPGESSFHRRERMTLHRDGQEGHYQVYRHETQETMVFSPARAGGPSLLQSIRDAWNNAITLEHDGERLSRIVDTAGREIQFQIKRDRIVRVEVRVDGALAQWVDYGYSAAGCLTSVTDALGRTEEYEYDLFHRMTAVTIKAGERFQYEYEKNTGRCRKTWGPKGLYAIELSADRTARTTSVDGAEPRVITWNDLGLATREALPDGTVLQETAYDEDGNVVARVNGSGEGDQSWYDAHGNRTRVVDAMGNVTAWEYDANDLPLRMTTHDGLVTTYVHDEKGALTQVRYPTGMTYALTYDERGRLTTVHENGALVRAFEYDRQHNILAETDARGARTTYTYDLLGRPVARTDALGRTTHVTRDRLGQILALRRADGSFVQRAYDAMGRLSRETDPLGQVTNMEYSGMGVLARLTQPGGQVWSFSYTSEERLEQVKSPRGESYSFSYDEAGRIVEEKTFDGRVLRYGHSLSGRVARIEYPDATARAFSYDRAGRLLLDEASDGSIIAYRRDKMGRLVEAMVNERGGRVSTSFERDALGRLVVERQGDRAIRYTYDARGRRLERVMPDGATTRYAYDAEDALHAVDHEGHKIVFERDALGREVRRGHAEGQLSIHSSYDAVDRLIEQRATVPSPGDGIPAVLVERLWQYDRAGRVTRVDDHRWGTTTLRYDRAEQLVGAARGVHREVFGYDPAGALVNALEGAEGRLSEPWKVAPGNLLERTETAKYTYDPRGRRTVRCQLGRAGAEGATDYAWDARDRLREVKLPDGTRVVMTYDAFGRRMRKEIFSSAPAAPRSVDFVWDGDALAADIDSEHGARCFVHLPGTLIPLLQVESRRVLTYVNDHLGTPKELLDRSGAIVWSAAHSAWGRVVETFSSLSREQTRGRAISSPFRLLGQYADEESGLCHTRFRCFDPEVGRWLSADPLGIGGGRDMFGFDGVPTVDVDPLGLTTGGPHPLRPEAGYLGSKKHGVGWREGPATARSTGTPQGQWGSRGDLDHAGQQAATLAPRQGGWFPLPAGHSSVVHRSDGTTVPATRMWLRNNGSGTFHGYPAE